MKIALFGATGRVGRYLLEKALNEGYSVNALVRSPEKLDAHEDLTIIKGDIGNEEDINNTLSGMNFVLSALGADDKSLTDSIPLIINSMNRHGIKRIVTIGTAGILESHIEPGKLRYEEKDTFRKDTFAVEEHHKMYELLNQSELEWTIICPTYLPDGEAIGNYRVRKNYLPEDGQQISVGDTANFAFQELLAKNYTGSRVGIAY